MEILAPFLLICLLGSSLSVAEPSCGGMLTNTSGVITSPNYPSNYPNNITCTWKISAEKSHLNLTIEDFMLEDSQTCEAFDFVKIRATGGNSRGQVTVCGSIASRRISLEVEGTAVEITFKSDFSFTARGFKISYRAYDVDPCLVKNGDCSHFCKLEKGKRVCSCPGGFKLTWNYRTCKEETSCYFVGHTKCPYRDRITCRDLPGGRTTCVCWRGYKKQNGKCQDVDECKEKPGRCGSGTCRNYRGWFSCRCPKGYRYHGSTCSDIDECKLYRPPDCGEATCINTPGSHVCQCARGYQFNASLLACQDIDECGTSSHGCDHVCTNTNGSYICSCRVGYFLNSDGKTCRAARVEGLGRVEDTSTCQGESLDITCKENQQALIIYKALFLRDGSGVCPYKNRQGLPENDSLQEIKCVDDVTDKIKSMCGWRKRCTITVNSDTLGGVCAGNYLTIRYSCGKPVMCKSLPPKLSCLATEEDECTSDESCHSSQMCCFDGCKRVCALPSLYSGET